MKKKKSAYQQAVEKLWYNVYTDSNRGIIITLKRHRGMKCIGKTKDQEMPIKMSNGRIIDNVDKIIFD